MAEPRRERAASLKGHASLTNPALFDAFGRRLKKVDHQITNRITTLLTAFRLNETPPPVNAIAPYAAALFYLADVILSKLCRLQVRMSTLYDLSSKK